MSGPLSDSPTRTVLPPEPRNEANTATLAPPEEPRDHTATQAPDDGSKIHYTRPFEGVGSPTSFPTPDDRYTLTGFLARGGMGEVWVAKDRVLNRDVAVKILRDDLKDRSFVASRFIEEARITGKLEHPGIIAIHDMGTFKDGRPFIAMKLIKGGRTLSDILANDRPELNELLRIFDHVCQAVAAAHDKRVIHRDIKPGNVMVGRFSEVQVMDWGLAKVLGEVASPTDSKSPEDHPTTAPVSVIESDRDPSSHTRAGSLLGTPAYMPPEQAKGEVDKTDTRSDVFALGALLCELLTGKPPYWAATSAEIQAYAITAQLGPAFVRLAASDADGELINLTKQCLSPNQDDRPYDAKRVADAIKRYREGVEDRLRRSERDRAAAEAKAGEELNTRREAEARAEAERARAEAERAKAEEHRKRRRVQMLLAMSAMLLILGAGAAAWWMDRQATERDRIQREKQAELDRAENDRKAAELRQEEQRLQHQKHNGEAIEALLVQVEEVLKNDDAIEKALLPLGQIDRRLPDGGADYLLARLKQARGDIQMLQRFDDIDDLIGLAENDRSKRVDNACQQAFMLYGLNILAERTLKEEPTFIESAVRAINTSTIRERLILGLDTWFLHHPKGRRPDVLRRILKALDPDPFRMEFREMLERTFDPAAGRAFLTDRPESFRQPARFVVLMGQTGNFPASLRDQILRGALERYPNNFPLILTMINVQESAPEYRLESVTQQFRWSQAAVTLRPNSKIAWRHLSRAYFDRGDIDSAVRSARRALRLDPNDLNSLVWVSSTFNRKHDPEAALEYAQRAVELYPNSSNASNALADVYRRLARYDESLLELNRAIRIDEMNGIQNGNYFNNRGYAYLQLGRYNEAVKDFQLAINVSGFGGSRLAESNLNYAKEMLRGGREIEIAPFPGPPSRVAPPPREKK